MNRDGVFGLEGFLFGSCASSGRPDHAVIISIPGVSAEALPCRHFVGVSPTGALILMTAQTASAVRVSHSGTFTKGLTPQATVVADASSAELRVPDTTNEVLLRRRDVLPALHPGRAVLRARVIEENLPMARRLARRYAGRGEPFDDLAQVAAMALVKAVDGYDSSREIPFLSYAIPSIVGALKRHFRDTAWGIRVPRPMQELILVVRTASGELGHRLGRPATPAEVAEHLNVALERLLAARAAAQAYRPVSLDASLVRMDAVGSAELLRAIGDTDPRYAAIDDHLMLNTLVAALAERDRRILTMRFYDEMTQTQIAAELGISQMHVSRLLRQILARLELAMDASIVHSGL